MEGLWGPVAASRSFKVASSAGLDSAVSEVKSSAAWIREANPETAVGTGGKKEVLDRLDGEDACDESREGAVVGISLATAGCSWIVATLPCLECPGRDRGTLGVSVFGMLLL